jgi:hypothetical protein
MITKATMNTKVTIVAVVFIVRGPEPASCE